VERRSRPRLITSASKSRARQVSVVRPFPSASTFRSTRPWLRRSVPGSGSAGRAIALDKVRAGHRIDRIDYRANGDSERLRPSIISWNAPEFHERLVFVQIGVPSRRTSGHYQALDDEIDTLVEKSTGGTAAIPGGRCVPQAAAFAGRDDGLHQLATFAMVTSLDDGMNLVRQSVKLLVACRSVARGPAC